ncbi:WGR domain-containing protein [Paracoccus sp. MC1862]|uniref:WGR domain-containing protein n=1 Tax=Paracoccus sp. MC1862 TaxID=2760307 RepID=UPI001F3BA34F|nr:WGR domain-containing protein [Paracoccus sp. MC1862]
MSEEQFDLLEGLAAHPSGSAEVQASDDAPAGPVRLTRIDPACNMQRFYSLELVTSLFGEHGVVRHWGRIGTAGRSRTDWYEEPGEAESAFQTLLQLKRKRGYAS